MRWLCCWILAWAAWGRAETGVYLVNNSSRICQVKCLDRSPEFRLKVQVSADETTDHVRTWLGPALDDSCHTFEVAPRGGVVRLELADEKDAGQTHSYRFCINGRIPDRTDNIVIYHYRPAGLQPAVGYWESVCQNPRVDIPGHVSLLAGSPVNVLELVDTPWPEAEPAGLPAPASPEPAGCCSRCCSRICSWFSF